jgi:hypothetical protein
MKKIKEDHSQRLAPGIKGELFLKITKAKKGEGMLKWQRMTPNSQLSTAENKELLPFSVHTSCASMSTLVIINEMHSGGKKS